MKNLIQRFAERYSADKIIAEILKGSSIAIALKVVAGFSAFASNLIVARYLGAEQAGYFFLAMTILSITGSLSSMGFEQGAMRFIASAATSDDRSEVRRIYTFVTCCTLISSFIYSVLIYFCADSLATHVFGKPEAAKVFKLAAFALIPLTLTAIHAHFFQGLKKVPPFVVLKSIIIPALTAFSIWIYAAHDPTTAISCVVFSSVVATIVAISLWHVQKDLRPVRTSFFENRILWRANLGLMQVTIAQILMYSGLRLMIGIWGTPEEIAIYSTAGRTAGLVGFVFIAINAISAPHFASLYHHKRLSELESTAKKTTSLLMVYGVIAAVFIIVFADFFMGLFGEQFREGATVLIIMAIGQCINVCTGSVSSLLNMTGNERHARNNHIISVVIIYIGGYLFIAEYGILAAALVGTIANSVQNLLGVWQVRRVLGFNILVFWKTSLESR